MKNMALISLFLVTIILSGIVIGTMSTIKTFVDTIELAEESSEGESNQGKNEIEEEEEQAISLTYKEEELAKKKISYYYPRVKLCYAVLEVLTPPPSI